MTPKEFAAQTGLSLEEAEMVLRLRARAQQLTEPSKLKRALEALVRAESKVGVKPYEEGK